MVAAMDDVIQAESVLASARSFDQARERGTRES